MEQKFHDSVSECWMEFYPRCDLLYVSGVGMQADLTSNLIYFAQTLNSLPIHNIYLHFGNALIFSKCIMSVHQIFFFMMEALDAFKTIFIKDKCWTLYLVSKRYNEAFYFFLKLMNWCTKRRNGEWTTTDRYQSPVYHSDWLHVEDPGPCLISSSQKSY